MRSKQLLALLAVLMWQVTDGIRLETEVERKKRKKSRLFSNALGMATNIGSTFGVPGMD